MNWLSQEERDYVSQKEGFKEEAKKQWLFFGWSMFDIEE